MPTKAMPAKKTQPKPEPIQEEAPYEEEDAPQEEAPPPRPTSRFQTRPPQRPEPEDRGQLRFPQGSLFEGDRSSKVLFAGTFHPDELHDLIEQAMTESIDPEKIRVKIFDVDEQYQTGNQHRVRITFCGLQQARKPGGGGYASRATGGRGNKRW